MRSIDCIKYSLRIIKQRISIVIIIMLSASFYCIFCSIQEAVRIYDIVSQDVNLKCRVFEADKDIIDDIQVNNSNVFGITQYCRSKQILRYGDYETEVTLIGCDQEYLEKSFSDIIQVPFGEGMPYVLIEKNALDKMQNKDGEKILNRERFEWVLNIVTLDISTDMNAGIQARINGVIESQKDERVSEEYFVYTTLEAYEDILNTVLENSEQMQGLDENLESETGKDTLDYLIRMNSGFGLKDFVENLNSNGIQVAMDEIQVLEKLWEESYDKGVRSLFLAAMAGTCGGILIYYLNKVWQMENHVFLKYLYQIAAPKNIYYKLRRWTIVACFFGGLVIAVVCFAFIR